MFKPKRKRKKKGHIRISNILELVFIMASLIANEKALLVFRLLAPFHNNWY